MRFTQEEKYEIIRIIEGSEIGVNRTLKEFGIHKSTFYNWYNKYLKDGYDGLSSIKKTQSNYWNKIPNEVCNQVVEVALEYPELSSREVAFRITDDYSYFISESSVYRILKRKGLITTPAFVLSSAADEFKDKTTRVNEMWQTDFTYFKIVNWGWYYLSTIIDDYSRYIVHWELCKNMKAEDAIRTVDCALAKAGINNENRPRLLSDNGSCYISQDLADYLNGQKMLHIRGERGHPQTQGKIERYHRSMKNIVKLDNYYSPEELERKIAEWVEYYNNYRYHESINNLTPAVVYFGKHLKILKHRESIKFKTMKERRKIYFSKLIL